MGSSCPMTMVITKEALRKANVLSSFNTHLKYLPLVMEHGKGLYHLYKVYNIAALFRAEFPTYTVLVPQQDHKRCCKQTFMGTQK